MTNLVDHKNIILLNIEYLKYENKNSNYSR